MKLPMLSLWPKTRLAITFPVCISKVVKFKKGGIPPLSIESCSILNFVWYWILWDPWSQDPIFLQLCSVVLYKIYTTISGSVILLHTEYIIEYLQKICYDSDLRSAVEYLMKPANFTCVLTVIEFIKYLRSTLFQFRIKLFTKTENGWAWLGMAVNR